MNTPLISLILLALCLQGCSVRKKVIQANEDRSGITLICHKSNTPQSILSGQVRDKVTHEVIPYTTIRLKSYGTAEGLGTISDDNGKFTITHIPIGDYQLIVESSGYEKIMQNIDLRKYSDCKAEIVLSPFISRTEKPVIYLYPTQQQTIQVKLNYQGILKHSYPKYPENGWHITAQPNGILKDENNREYYALFWEGFPAQEIVPEDGFVVPGGETAAFLEDKLAFLGLNRREANEFIMYWLPRLEDNPYNFIHFAGKQYEEQAALDVIPKPQTVIRVMMLTQPLDHKINMPLQDLNALKKTREGFTLVEWGGSVIHTIVEKI